jgi:hypothetical protein
MIVRLQRRSLVALTALLALLAMAIVLSACGSSAGTSGGTSGGSGDTKTYTDSSYGYSFAYPASWQTQNDTSVDVTAGANAAGGVGVFNPHGAKAGSIYIDLLLVSVYKLTKTIDDSMLPQLKSEIESVLQSLESQGPDLKVEQALAETTAAGMKGYDVTYSFTKDGAPCTSTLYFLFNGNIEYQLTTQASNDNWAADQSIFDAMIASFKPGTSQ